MKDFRGDGSCFPSEIIEECAIDMWKVVENTANTLHIPTDTAMKLIGLTVNTIRADDFNRQIDDLETNLYNISNEFNGIKEKE